MSLATITQLQATGFFGSMDAQVAKLAARVNPGAGELSLLAAALASRAISLGHACADLADYAGHAWSDILTREMPATRDNEDGAEADEDTAPHANLGTLPGIEVWINALGHPLVGTGKETGPARTLFVQKDGRVYLRRYWHYERTVEDTLISLNQSSGLTIDEQALDGYFKPEAIESKAAARMAIENKLSLLSGGPGTGKTYTMARAVALLGELARSQGREFKVSLAAPTGKAAVRMVESLKGAKEELRKEGKTEAQLDAIPEIASTIHRLLGANYHSPYFKHDAKHPVDADMVIVDEASMVDLPLMAKLLDALPGTCSLMLVGDVDQLASVEPGRVYGDVCHAAENGNPLAGCLTRLTRSHRFPEGSPIGRISRLVNEGRADDALAALLEHAQSPQLQVLDSALLDDKTPSFISLVKEQLEGFMKATEEKDALAAAANFRILCALRNGRYGVKRMNRRVENILADSYGLKPGTGFYDHQLIMIKVNTPSLNLYNGDVGVILAKPKEKNAEKQSFLAWFPDAEKGARSVSVGLLPEHETAFAMTIHKSQGSEFPNVALILPDNAYSPVLTRELLYTGMTRVKIDPVKHTGKLTLWCTGAGFTAAIRKRTTRVSGLFKTVQSKGEGQDGCFSATRR